MPYTTEFVTFAVTAGKESRAGEWMALLKARRQECIATLERERMHFESIFRHESNGRLHLSWFAAQGAGGADVESSDLEIDRLHTAFFRECIDPGVPPIKHEHLMDFVPAEVASAIEAREARLFPQPST
jgi:hypothetical protein